MEKEVKMKDIGHQFLCAKSAAGEKVIGSSQTVCRCKPFSLLCNFSAVEGHLSSSASVDPGSSA